MNLSYNGNDGYDEPEYPGNGVSILFCVGVAAGLMLAAWQYYSMFWGS